MRKFKPTTYRKLVAKMILLMLMCYAAYGLLIIGFVILCAWIITLIF